MLISEEVEIQIVGEASNGERLVELALKLVPDIILTDLKMLACIALKRLNNLKTLV